MSTTQTTATLVVENVYKEYKTTCYGKELKKEGEKIDITGLRPGYTFGTSIYVSNDVKSYYYNENVSTQPISPSIEIRQKTASSLSVVGSYIEGDAEVSRQRICIDGTWTNTNSGKLTGLNPHQAVKAKFSITAAGYTYTSNEVTLTTDALLLETQQPKVISEGNVIVAAKSNLDDEEEKVGFEWRRQDWNDDFDSKEGGAYLYDGQMEGYIRSLNANYLWKFRPYYEANDGTRYYGEWKGMDPSDFSYFDPTVHTYAKIAVNGNVATVKGYAQRGTDNIMSQGFKYWVSTSGVKGEARYAPSVPRDAQTVEATGTVMEVDLTGLDYETTYHYVAYVTTSEGETFYGEELTFTTGEDLTPVEGVEAESVPVVPAAYYNMQGRRIPRPERGINIVRYSNGSTRKVLVK